MNKFFKIVAGLTMVLFLVSSAYSFTKKDPDNSVIVNPAGITYIVDINFTHQYGVCDSYYVMVCNEDGTPVAPPRLFQEGVTSYVFHESGNVNETRVAHMERVQMYGPTVCNEPLYAPPASITNNFMSGSTYVFNLYPLVIPGDD